jgi:hypothetical protein
MLRAAAESAPAAHRRPARERLVGRAGNDPRINPQPVTSLEIVTESLLIDPTTFPPVDLPVSTRPKPPRAPNDPRIGRPAASPGAE